MFLLSLTVGIGLPQVARADEGEPGRVLAELGAGMLTSVGGLALSLTAAELHSPEGGFMPLILGPTATGLVVCGIGRGSALYQGTCTGPVLGAYLGALLSVPSALIGCALDQPGPGPHNDEEENCLAGLALGFVAGWGLGSSVGAVVGWNVGKSPRPPAKVTLPQPPPDLPGRPVFAPQRPAPSLAVGHRVLVPLLAVSF